MSGNGRHPDSSPKVRVLLCHDFPVARAGLRITIDAEGDMQVVGEADDVESGMELVDELQPDVIVANLYINGPGGNGPGGLEALRTMKGRDPQVKILVQVDQGSGDYFLLAMRAGADGYLTRGAAPREVVNAIRSVRNGQNYLDPSMVTRLVNTYVCKTRREGLEDRYDTLSEREREVLCLVASEHTTSEIAQVLRLSKQTVHNVRARLMEKLGLHDRVQLVKYAIRRGIVSTKDM